MRYWQYYVILFYLVVCYINEENNKKSKFLLNSKYTWVILFIFAGFRGSGDGDYFNYLAGVPEINSLSKVFFVENYPFEIGFRFIAYLNNLLMLKPQFTLMVLSLISLKNVDTIIKKYSKSISLSWLLYFPFLILFDMHHTRNAVAMVFTMRVFFSLFSDENLYKSVFYGCLSLMFHKSSVLSLIILYSYYFIYPLFNKKDSNLKIKILNIVLIFMTTYLIGLNRLVNFFVYLFPKNELIKKMKYYMLSSEWSYSYSLLDPRFILLVLTFILSVYFIKNQSDDLKHFNNMIYVAICLVILLSDSTMITMRFYNYFNIYTIFLIPQLVYEVRDRVDFKANYNLFIYTGVIFYIIYFALLVLKQVPYKLFIFNR